MDILSKIQTELVAPKNQRNNFGKYNYRSCEDILEGLKPLLLKYECSVVLTDDIIMVGDRIYVKATASLYGKVKSLAGECIDRLAESTAFAREPKEQKGMNEAQITGSASSYARKYALNGLFAIDDSKDADTNEHRDNANNRPAVNKSKVVSEEEKRRKIFNHFESGQMDGVVKDGYIADLKAKNKSYDQVIAELGIK